MRGNSARQITADGFDVIGDVHGHVDKLVSLLTVMGYAVVGDAWRHPTRTAVFVGDLIDRGPHQVDCVRIARAMVEAGSAQIVAGNHEFNAIAFHTPDPENPGQYLRPHNQRNLDQHGAFLAQVGTPMAERVDDPVDEQADEPVDEPAVDRTDDPVGEPSILHQTIIDWFRTLPLWLDLGGLRVVHACWDEAAMHTLRSLVGAAEDDGVELSPALVEAASRKGSEPWQAVEHVLKGPEIDIAPAYVDPNGHRRDRARFGWWSPDSGTLAGGAVIPKGTTTADGLPYPELSDDPIDPPVTPYLDRVPVIYGHYWETGEQTRSGPHTACVDYSAARNGPLVAYRWSGEAELDDDNFCSSADSS